MSAMATSRTNPPTSSQDFRRRLGYYLTGLAIGCFMAGGIYYARKAQWQQEQMAREQAERQDAEQAMRSNPLLSTQPATKSSDGAVPPGVTPAK